MIGAAAKGPGRWAGASLFHNSAGPIWQPPPTQGLGIPAHERRRPAAYESEFDKPAQRVWAASGGFLGRGRVLDVEVRMLGATIAITGPEGV